MGIPILERQRFHYIETAPCMYDSYINARTHRGWSLDILVNIGLCNGLTPLMRQVLNHTYAD